MVAGAGPNNALHVRYLPTTITTPAGTTAAAPQVTAIDLGDTIALSLRLRIPPGHVGLTGFRVDYSQTTIVPFSNPSVFIVGEDESYDFDIGVELGNTLQVVTYNIDTYPHSHYLLWRVTDKGAVVPAPVTFVDIQA